ncbi:unnamed protein product, partial [Polarella glacialis]
AILEVEAEPRRLTRLSVQLKTKWEIINRTKDEPDADDQAMIFGVVPGQHEEEYRRAKVSAKALIIESLAAVDFVRELLHRDVEGRSNVYKALKSKFLCDHLVADPLMADGLKASVKSLMIVNRR